MFRWKAAVGALVVATLALAGCTSTEGGGGDDAEAGGTLTLGLVIAPTSLDPGLAEWGGRSIYYQAAYDTLLVSTADGNLEPFLATDWSYNDDFTVLTLKLRDDVTFTDGTSLTADVVAENLLRFQGGTSPDAGLLGSMANAEAAGDDTVVITLTAPDPAFLNYLARSPGLVASGEAIESGVLADETVGSGPYILQTDQTVDGSSYTYTKNPDGREERTGDRWGLGREGERLG